MAGRENSGRIIAVVALVCATVARAQPSPVTGIFTEQQAAAGKALYETHCASCHGAELRNGPRTSSALIGTEFIRKWGAKPTASDAATWTGLKLDALLADSIATMPPARDNPVSPDQQLLILTYVLHRNGFPAGSAALAADSPVMRDATLEFRPTVGAVGREQRLLVWVDRQGREQVLPAPPRHYYLPRISPDGTKIAVEIHLDKPDIWIADVATGALRQLTREGTNRYPAWSPDGRRVLYGSERSEKSQVYWQAADGSGAAEQLTFGPYEHGPQSWTPDGKTLSFYEINPETYRDIWMLPMEGDRKPWPFLRTPHLEGGVEYSRDGKWMVHTSNETGKYEVIMRGYPDASIKRQISTDGGVEVIWPRGNREVFYKNDRKLMAVEIVTSATLDATTVGQPRVMVEGDYVRSPGSRANWDSRDGRRFLMVRKAE
jgi:hypothetical protein